MSHPVIERSDLTPDEMIEHNRRVHFQYLHAGQRYYAGKRRGVELWENVFGERVDGPGEVDDYPLRRAADLERIPPYYESPR